MRASFAALLLCVACVSNRPQVVQIGPDTFRVSRIARNQSATYDTLRAEVLLVEDSGPAFRTVKGYTGSQVEFRCVAEPN